MANKVVEAAHIFFCTDSHLLSALSKTFDNRNAAHCKSKNTTTKTRELLATLSTARTATLFSWILVQKHIPELYKSLIYVCDSWVETVASSGECSEVQENKTLLEEQVQVTWESSNQTFLGRGWQHFIHTHYTIIWSFVYHLWCAVSHER